MQQCVAVVLVSASRLMHRRARRTFYCVALLTRLLLWALLARPLVRSQALLFALEKLPAGRPLNVRLDSSCNHGCCSATCGGFLGAIGHWRDDEGQRPKWRTAPCVPRPPPALRTLLCPPAC